MAPFFETAKSYADVTMSEDGVDTVTFLQASDDLVNMFELFGSTVFGFVQSDIRSNIAGVRARYQAFPDLSSTLESLVANESKGGQRVATACLVRLIRGLALTYHALQHMREDPSMELHVCFKRSYDIVLKHHHSFIIRSVVSIAIRAVPRRHDFYMKLLQDGSPEKLDEEMGKWLVALNEIVKKESAFLVDGGFGKV